MSKHKLFWRNGVLAVMLTAVAGCYSYKEPTVAAMGESYSARERDNAEDMFKNMSLLTLRDAQRIAIKNNPTYIAAYHSMEAARMKYLQAWGAYSPTLTASYQLSNGRSWVTRGGSAETASGVRPYTDRFSQNVGISAQMLLFDGFGRLFRLKAAKSDFNYYARMEEDACRTMMQAVAYAYNTVLLAIENRRIALEDRDFQKSSLQNTQYKFEAGAAPLSDVLNFEIYVNSADVSLIAADYQYEVAIYALAQLMGYPEGTLPSHLKFPEDYKAKFAELPAVEIYLDAALANRPDLKAYRERLNVAKYQVYQAWSAYSPVVYGFVDFDFTPTRTEGREYNNPGVMVNNAPLRTGGNTTKRNEMGLYYGIQADWTLFNGFIRTNQLREAKAARAVAEYQVAANWFTVVNEVRTAYANYIQSVKQTKLYAKIRALSAKQRDLVDDEYRAGNAELTRLNEAQRDLVEAETSLASSYINVQNAKAQLDAVVGGNTADYYMTNDGKNEVYPGLGGVADIQKKIDSSKGGNGKKQSAPVQAPDVKRTLPGTPVKKAPAPAVKAPAPVVKAPAPAVKAPAPVVKAPAPVKKSSAPVKTTVVAAAEKTAAPVSNSAVPAIPESATAAPQKR